MYGDDQSGGVKFGVQDLLRRRASFLIVFESGGLTGGIILCGFCVERIRVRKSNFSLQYILLGKLPYLRVEEV